MIRLNEADTFAFLRASDQDNGQDGNGIGNGQTSMRAFDQARSNIISNHTSEQSAPASRLQAYRID